MCVKIADITTPYCTSSAADMSPMAEAVSVPSDQPTTSSSHQSGVSDTDDQNLDQENVEMLLNQKMSAIQTERCNTRASQVRQAERMVKRSRIVLVAGQVEDNVAVPIPLVDRGRGDPRNILGIILDRDENVISTLWALSVVFWRENSLEINLISVHNDL
jgi:hypothetical protein